MVSNDDTQVRSATERLFVKKWWCRVGGEVRHGNLVSNKFGACALRQSEWDEGLTLETSVSLSFYGGNLSLINLFRISNFKVQDI